VQISTVRPATSLARVLPQAAIGGAVAA